MVVVGRMKSETKSEAFYLFQSNPNQLKPLSGFFLFRYILIPLAYSITEDQNLAVKALGDTKEMVYNYVVEETQLNTAKNTPF